MLCDTEFNHVHYCDINNKKIIISNKIRHFQHTENEQRVKC